MHSVESFQQVIYINKDTCLENKTKANSDMGHFVALCVEGEEDRETRFAHLQPKASNPIARVVLCWHVNNNHFSVIILVSHDPLSPNAMDC
jgi:hypothetical protein